MYFELEKLYIKKVQLVFSSKIEMPQLGSARLGTAQEIPAGTHH
jgi:hypothetical protein